MASNTRKLGGYDLNFVEDPPDDLICLICTLMAKDPQQVTCCGKIFCRVCLTEHKKYSDACPQCRKVGGSDFMDQRSKKAILSWSWPWVLCYTPVHSYTKINAINCFSFNRKANLS